MIVVNKNKEACIQNLVNTEFQNDENALQKATDSVNEYYHFLQGVKQIYASNIMEAD